MNGSAADPLLELPAWQAILAGKAELFADLVPGAAIGLVPRFVRGADGATRASAQPSVPSTGMLVWERQNGGMTACSRSFSGISNAAVDALLFVERDALREVLQHAEPLSEMKRQIRKGRILLMVMRTKNELRSRGFEEVFEALGLPFMGACR
jgi:hypothetical protein